MFKTTENDLLSSSEMNIPFPLEDGCAQWMLHLKVDPIILIYMYICVHMFVYVCACSCVKQLYYTTLGQKKIYNDIRLQ